MAANIFQGRNFKILDLKIFKGSCDPDFLLQSILWIKAILKLTIELFHGRVELIISVCIEETLDGAS